MGEFVREVVRFWPLSPPRAIGINFVVSGPYDESVNQDNLVNLLTPKDAVEAILGAPIKGVVQTFDFDLNGAKVKLKVITDAIIGDRPGVCLRPKCSPCADFRSDAVIATQEEWLTRLWSGGKHDKCQSVAEAASFTLPAQRLAC